MHRIVLWLGIPLVLLGGNWPQWRGPNSSGVSEEPNLPVEWSGTRNIAWKTAIPGFGHSSPVIWGDRIFLTTAIEGEIIAGAEPPKHTFGGKEFKHPSAMGANRAHRLVVLCLDRKSGRVLWERTAHDGRVFDDRHKKASYANPTPVTDGKTLFAYFGTEGLFAFDFEGKLLWRMSPGKLMSVGLGVASSPVLHEDRLFLQCDFDSGPGSFMLAVDKATGKEVWRVERKNQASWSTPILLDAKGRKELIASGTESVIAYDPKTGKELWRSKGVVGNAVPSPVSGHGMVFVAAGYPEKRAYGIRLGGRGDISEKPELVWSYDKGVGYVPSPILYGAYLYVMSDRGLVTCLDAKTGERRYEGQRVPKPATFTASPVAYGGRLFLTSEEGETFVLKAGPVHEVLATNSLGEAVYASPAMAGGSLYIRGVQHLFCVRDGVN